MLFSLLRFMASTASEARKHTTMLRLRDPRVLESVLCSWHASILCFKSVHESQPSFGEQANTCGGAAAVPAAEAETPPSWRTSGEFENSAYLHRTPARPTYRNVANSPRRPASHSVSSSAQCGRQSCSTLNTTCHIGAEETVQAWQSWQLQVTASPFESVRARHVEETSSGWPSARGSPTLDMRASREELDVRRQPSARGVTIYISPSAFACSS